MTYVFPQWSLIHGFAPDEDRMSAAFQRLWSLKEVRVGSDIP